MYLPWFQSLIRRMRVDGYQCSKIDHLAPSGAFIEVEHETTARMVMIVEMWLLKWM